VQGFAVVGYVNLPDGAGRHPTSVLWRAGKELVFCLASGELLTVSVTGLPDRGVTEEEDGSGTAGFRARPADLTPTMRVRGVLPDRMWATGMVVDAGAAAGALFMVCPHVKTPVMVAVGWAPGSTDGGVVAVAGAAAGPVLPIAASWKVCVYVCVCVFVRGCVRVLAFARVGCPSVFCLISRTRASDGA
jgi:hypothetical protein